MNGQLKEVLIYSDKKVLINSHGISRRQEALFFKNMELALRIGERIVSAKVKVDTDARSYPVSFEFMLYYGI